MSDIDTAFARLDATANRIADERNAYKAEIERLRVINAELVAASQWFIDDINGTHTVMIEFDEAVRRLRTALTNAKENTK